MGKKIPPHIKGARKFLKLSKQGISLDNKLIVIQRLKELNRKSALQFKINWNQQGVADAWDWDVVEDKDASSNIPPPP